MPTNGPQTFTSPSGGDVYTTRRRRAARRHVPRHALRTERGLAAALGAASHWTVGLSRLLHEYDYTHLGANLRSTATSTERNTTLVGVA